MKLKKAAMFGLDARIALAIFGALSVISGAALYSAIQQSKVISYVAQLNEIAKAYEAYYLDTGQKPSFVDTINLNAATLVENVDNASGWSGPYISGEPKVLGGASINSYVLFDGRNLILTKAKKSDWGAWGGSDIQCSDKEDCAIFIRFYNFELSFLQELDMYVDGSLDPKTGKVKYEESSGNYYLYYYVMPTNDLTVGVSIY